MPTQHSRSVELLWRLLGTVASGVLLVFAFPPHDLMWLAPIAVAIATLSWHGARTWTGFWLGLVFAVSFFLPHIAWMRVVGDDAWVMLSALFAPAFGLLGAGVAITSRLKVWPLAVPLMWVTTEALRDRFPFNGFPWGRLAFSQASSPLASYAALAGAPLVTAVVALIGTLLAYAWRRRRSPRLCVASLIGVALLSTAGGVVPIATVGTTSGGPASVTAAVVQGSVPGVGLDFLGQREAVLQNHVKETLVLAADVKSGKTPRPDFVIWPENSTDIDPLVDQQAGELIQTAVDAMDVPILVGAVVNVPSDPTHIWNAGIVWMPTHSATPGPTSFYVKQHPVPFGEYIPMRSLISHITDRLDRIPRDFAAGDSTGVMQLGPARIGDLICFEVAYDELARAATIGSGVVGPLAGRGARVLTIQTNNATYAHTGQPEQQLAMSRLRAIEHGRSVLIASTSGISAIIRPDGSFAGVLGESGPGYLVDQVALRDDITVSDRLGGWPEGLAVLLAAGCIAAAAMQNRRERRVGSTDSTDHVDPIQELAP